MPHFWNKKEKYYVSTNFRVMSSHLSVQQDLQNISTLQLLWFRFWHWFKFSNRIQFYLLIRNPYTRLESVFRGKRKYSPDLSNQNPLQYCQQLIVNALNKKTNLTKKQILTNLKFEEFIEILPNFYQKDGHFYPQSKLIYCKGLYNQYIKIDNQKGKHFIENQLKISLQQNYSLTNKNEIETNWSSEMITLVNLLYAQDFKEFNYQKK